LDTSILYQSFPTFADVFCTEVSLISTDMSYFDRPVLYQSFPYLETTILDKKKVVPTPPSAEVKNAWS